MERNNCEEELWYHMSIMANDCSVNYGYTILSVLLICESLTELLVLHTVVVSHIGLQEVPKKRPQFVRKVRRKLSLADDTSRCFNLIMTYMEWSHSTDILQIGWNKASFLQPRNKQNFPSNIKVWILAFQASYVRAKSVQLLSDDDMLPLHSNDCCSRI